MKKVLLNSVPVLKFSIFKKFSKKLNHAVLSRKGGFSKKPFDSLNVRFGIGDKLSAVKKNRKKICLSLGIAGKNLVLGAKLISADQTHSKNVAIVDLNFLKKLGEEKKLEPTNVDGFVTDLKEIALMIQVADCQAILFFDPKKHIVAAVHAGWKGLKKDISGQAIKIMKNKFGVDAENILAGIAPSLGPCCAYFTNPKKELPKSFHKFIDKQKRVNLWEYSLAQLIKHGIKPNNIELARICTQCGRGARKGTFFSFRGDKGVTGRFGVAIKLNS